MRDLPFAEEEAEQQRPRYFTRYYSVAILAGSPSSSSSQWGSESMSSSSCTPQRGGRHAAAEQSSSGGMCWIRIFLLANNRDNIPAIHSGQYLVCEFANRTRLYWCKFRILRQPPSRPRRMSPTEYTFIHWWLDPLAAHKPTAKTDIPSSVLLWISILCAFAVCISSNCGSFRGR